MIEVGRVRTASECAVAVTRTGCVGFVPSVKEYHSPAPGVEIRSSIGPDDAWSPAKRCGKTVTSSPRGSSRREAGFAIVSRHFRCMSTRCACRSACAPDRVATAWRAFSSLAESAFAFSRLVVSGSPTLLPASAKARTSRFN